MHTVTCAHNAHMDAHIYMHTQVHTHTGAHTSVYIHAHICTQVQVQCTHRCICTLQTHKCTHIHAHTVHMGTHVYIRHRHTCTQTHSSTQGLGERKLPSSGFPNGNQWLWVDISRLSENIKNMICYAPQFSPLHFFVLVKNTSLIIARIL
jgi:hypothetical protein